MTNTSAQKILIVGAGLGATNVRAMLLLLEQGGIEAQAVNQGDIVVLEPASRRIPLRVLAEAAPPLLYCGGPKLKAGRSELAQLRKRAMHNKARKP